MAGGRKHSLETRKKIGMAQMGIKKSEEHKKKISKSMREYQEVISEEEREALRQKRSEASREGAKEYWRKVKAGEIKRKPRGPNKNVGEGQRRYWDKVRSGEIERKISVKSE